MLNDASSPSAAQIGGVGRNLTKGLYAPAMDQNKSPLERAFELARSGRFRTVSEVKQAVAAEGYAMAQFQGRSLSRQLSEIIREAERVTRKGP